jgi:hypothetical protein
MESCCTREIRRSLLAKTKACVVAVVTFTAFMVAVPAGFAEQRPALRTLFLEHEDGGTLKAEGSTDRITPVLLHEKRDSPEVAAASRQKSKTPADNLDKILPSAPVKPWVPGRAGLGVRVEMTW